MSAGHSGMPCSRCGASQKPGDTFCWLCFSPLAPAVAAEVQASSSAIRSPRAFSTASPPVESGDAAQNPFLVDSSVAQSVGAGSWAAVAVTSLLLFLICVVTYVLYLAMPGVAILFALFVIVPLLRTMIVSWHRAGRGKSVSMARRIEMFMTSLAVMVGLVLLWGLSAVVGVVALCFTAVGASNSGRDPTAIVVLFGVGFVGVILFLTSLVVWNRYRRDVDRD